VSWPGHAFSPRERTPGTHCTEAGWAPESVWTQRIEEKSLHLCQGSNFDHLVIQSVVRHYTDLATSALTKHVMQYLYKAYKYNYEPFLLTKLTEPMRQVLISLPRSGMVSASTSCCVLRSCLDKAQPGL
jgi:hypothetical protein